MRLASARRASWTTRPSKDRILRKTCRTKARFGGPSTFGDAAWQAHLHLLGERVPATRRIDATAVAHPPRRAPQEEKATQGRRPTGQPPLLAMDVDGRVPLPSRRSGYGGWLLVVVVVVVVAVCQLHRRSEQTAVHPISEIGTAIPDVVPPLRLRRISDFWTQPVTQHVLDVFSASSRANLGGEGDPQSRCIGVSRRSADSGRGRSELIA